MSRVRAQDQAGTVCAKRRFRDQLGAEIVLASIAQRERKRRTASEERRAYLCPRCKGWHLTSEPPRA